MFKKLTLRLAKTGDRYRYEVKTPLPSADFREPTVDEVREHWMYIHSLSEQTIAIQEATIAEQAQLLETMTTMAADMHGTVEKARHLVSVIVTMARGGTPAFRVNEDAEPQDGDLLRHAVLDLQANLEGEDATAFALQGATIQ